MKGGSGGGDSGRRETMVGDRQTEAYFSSPPRFSVCICTRVCRKISIHIYMNQVD